MRIPTTLNAYSVALAGLGHHTLGGADSGQVTGNLPIDGLQACLLYTSPSPRDRQKSRMPSSA